MKDSAAFKQLSLFSWVRNRGFTDRMLKDFGVQSAYVTWYDQDFEYINLALD
jgi:hypothetical protein